MRCFFIDTNCVHWELGDVCSTKPTPRELGVLEFLPEKEEVLERGRGSLCPSSATTVDTAPTIRVSPYSPRPVHWHVWSMILLHTFTIRARDGWGLRGTTLFGRFDLDRVVGQQQQAGCRQRPETAPRPSSPCRQPWSSLTVLQPGWPEWLASWPCHRPWSSFRRCHTGGAWLGAGFVSWIALSPREY